MRAEFMILHHGSGIFWVICPGMTISFDEKARALLQNTSNAASLSTGLNGAFPALMRDTV
jgi:hypothetical protein